MLRVETVKQGSRTTISIAGRLESSHLQDVESECATATGNVMLDLTALRSTDEGTIRWLIAWIGRGGRVVGESPYIQLLIDRAMRDSGR